MSDPKPGRVLIVGQAVVARLNELRPMIESAPEGEALVVRIAVYLTPDGRVRQREGEVKAVGEAGRDRGAMRALRPEGGG